MIKMIKIKKAPALIQLFALLIISIPSLVFSGEITVTHGKFDHFNIHMPEPITAGEDVTVKLQAVDNLNNSISSFGEPRKSFTISVTGSATVKPSSFDSSSITDGTLSFIFNDKTAENGTLSITEGGGPLPIFSKEFSVIPNKLSSLAVKGPRTVSAGERFEVKIIEKDSFGNMISEPIYGKNLNISFKGSTEPKVDAPSISEFKNGMGVVYFTAEKTGTVMIEVKDMATGSAGISEKINVINGPLHSFKILHPREVIAGESFDLSVVPVDRFGNVISNYSSTGNGVVIASSGKQKPFPSTIPAYAFVNGQVKVALRYDEAETVKLTVIEIGGRQAGSSDSIVFAPPTPEKFEIVTPDSVIAGQKFKVKIIVYNQLSHVIRNYNLIGTDVLLTTTGTGTLMPNRVPPSEFVNGIAIVDLQYNKSESFEITASAERLSTAPAAGKTASVAAAVEQQKEAKAEDGEIRRVFEIKNISIEEVGKRATVAIRIEGIDNSLIYKIDTEKINDKKWMIISIKPAVNKIEGRLKLVSSFVSNVTIEEDKKEGDAVLIRMKLLKPAFYNISKGSNSLNVILKQ